MDTPSADGGGAVGRAVSSASRVSSNASRCRPIPASRSARPVSASRRVGRPPSARSRSIALRYAVTPSSARPSASSDRAAVMSAFARARSLADAIARASASRASRSASSGSPAARAIRASVSTTCASDDRSPSISCRRRAADAYSRARSRSPACSQAMARLFSMTAASWRASALRYRARLSTPARTAPSTSPAAARLVAIIDSSEARRRSSMSSDSARARSSHAAAAAWSPWSVATAPRAMSARTRRSSVAASSGIVEDARQQRVSTIRVTRLEAGICQPVGRAQGIDRSTDGPEHLHGLGRLRAARHASARAGTDASASPRQQLRAHAPITGALEQRPERDGCLVPVAGREQQVRLEAVPAIVTPEERGRWQAQTAGDEVQGGHRRLRMSLFEGADVRLGVATLRQLLLGQAGSQTRGTDARADAEGQTGSILPRVRASCHGSRSVPPGGALDHPSGDGPDESSDTTDRVMLSLWVRSA